MSKKYIWISVGGNSCEPAVQTKEGIFTLGCADPLDVTSVVIVNEMEDAPDTPAEAERKRIAWEKKIASDAKQGIIHGYRRFE